MIMLIFSARSINPSAALAWAGEKALTAPPAADTAEDVGEQERRSTPRLKVSAQEKELMARAVYSEARGESFTGQVCVAAVIINRVLSDDFPGDVEGVIFQPWAFTAVHDGQFWLQPDAQAYRAVEEALKGEDPTNGALFYYNPAKASSAWIFSRPVIKTIGKHTFAR